MADSIEKIKISELTETTTANDNSYIPIDNGQITYKISVANYNSGANATAKSYAQQAAASATSAATSKTAVEDIQDEINNVYSDFEDEKADLINQFSHISQDVASASNSATSAASSAQSAANSAESAAQLETSALAAATRAQSWAVGGTNTRLDEDTDNSKYYAEQAQDIVDHLAEELDVEEYVYQYLEEHPPTVSSVNGEVGDVVIDVPTKTSDLTNDSGFLTSAPVTKVNNKTGNVMLTASDVGALPSSTSIPSKTSDLTNDSGFLTSANAVTSFNGNTGPVTYSAPISSVNGRTGAVNVKCRVIDCGTVSSLPKTVTNSNITANMVVVNSELGTPSAQTSNWTVTTSAGSLTIAGSISGSTTVKLYLMES